MFILTSAYKPSVVRSNPVVGYAITREGFIFNDIRYDEVCAVLRLAGWTGAGYRRFAKGATMGDNRVQERDCTSMHNRIMKLLTDNPEWGVSDGGIPLPRRQLLHVFACFCREAAQHGGFAVTWKKGWD